MLQEIKIDGPKRMQINDGAGWYDLPGYGIPKELTGEEAIAFQALDDPTLRGFQAAQRLSNERGHALFRLHDGEEGKPFWVDMSSIPRLLPDMMMTVLLTISPADLTP